MEMQEDPFSVKIAWLYFIANGISAAMSTTFSPISNSLQTYYSASENTIFYLNSVYMIYFLIVNFFANYSIDKYGVKNSVNLCLVLTLVGAWLRIMIQKKLVILLLGQTIMACAYPFISNCLSKISNIWFNPKRRVKMTSLMSSSYMFGIGFGFLLTSFYWQDKNDELSVTVNLKNLMYFSALCCSFASVPVFLYFREEPDIPPSFSAEAKREEFLTSVFILKNKDFVLLFISFSLAYGNYITINQMIHHVLAPFGLDEFQISVVGVIINIFSGLSKIVVAYIAGEYISLKKIIVYIFILQTITVALFLFAMNTANIIFIYVIAALMGFFCQMYWGPALEFACEIVYPVSESHANGYLLLGGNIAGLVTNYAASLLYSHFSNPENFFIYLIVSYLLCVILTFFISDRMNREEFEMHALKNINTLRKDGVLLQKY
jgi:FLVCR family feline leukemia virus subgroup C receptor-related protein